MKLRAYLVIAFCLMASLGRAASYDKYKGDWVDSNDLSSGLRIESNGGHYLVYNINPETGEVDTIAFVFEPRNGLLFLADNTDDSKIIYLENETRIELRFKRTTVSVWGSGGYVNGGTQTSENYQKMERLTSSIRGRAEDGYRRRMQAQEKQQRELNNKENENIGRGQTEKLIRREKEKRAYFEANFIQPGNIVRYIYQPPETRTDILRYATLDTIIARAPEASLRSLDQTELSLLINEGGAAAEDALQKRIGRNALIYARLSTEELKGKVRQRDFINQLSASDLTFPLANSIGEYGLRNISRTSINMLAAFGPGTSIYGRLQREKKHDGFGRDMSDKIAHRLKILAMPTLAEIASQGWNEVPWGAATDEVKTRFSNAKREYAPDHWIVTNHQSGGPLKNFGSYYVTRAEFLLNRTGKYWGLVLYLDDSRDSVVADDGKAPPKFAGEDLRDEIIEIFGSPSGTKVLSTKVDAETFREGSVEINFSGAKKRITIRNHAFNDNPTTPKALDAWSGPLNELPDQQMENAPYSDSRFSRYLPINDLVATVSKASDDELRALSRNQLLGLCDLHDAKGEAVIKKAIETRIGKRTIQLALWHPASWYVLFLQPNPSRAANEPAYFNPFLGALERLTPQDITFDLAVFLAKNSLPKLQHLRATYSEDSATMVRLKSLAQTDAEFANVLKNIRLAFWSRQQQEEILPTVYLDEQTTLFPKFAPEAYGVDPLLMEAVKGAGTAKREGKRFDWSDTIKCLNPEQLRALDTNEIQDICNLQNDYTALDVTAQKPFRDSTAENLLVEKIGQRAVELALLSSNEFLRFLGANSPEAITRAIRSLKPEDITYARAVDLLMFRDQFFSKIDPEFLVRVFRESSPIVGRLKSKIENKEISLADIPGSFEKNPLPIHLHKLIVELWSMPIPQKPDFIGALLAANNDQLANNRDLKKYIPLCSVSPEHISTRIPAWLASIPPPNAGFKKAARQECLATWQSLEGDFAKFFKTNGVNNSLLDYAPTPRQQLYDLLQRREVLSQMLTKAVAVAQKQEPKVTVPNDLNFPSTNPSCIEQVRDIICIKAIEIRGWPRYEKDIESLLFPQVQTIDTKADMEKDLRNLDWTDAFRITIKALESLRIGQQLTVLLNEQHGRYVPGWIEKDGREIVAITKEGGDIRVTIRKKR